MMGWIYAFCVLCLVQELTENLTGKEGLRASLSFGFRAAELLFLAQIVLAFLGGEP